MAKVGVKTIRLDTKLPVKHDPQVKYAPKRCQIKLTAADGSVAYSRTFDSKREARENLREYRRFVADQVECKPEELTVSYVRSWQDVEDGEEQTEI